MKRNPLSWPTVLLLAIGVIILLVGGYFTENREDIGLSTMILFLLPAGIFAGLANYYITYLGLPITTPVPVSGPQGNQTAPGDGEPKRFGLSSLLSGEGTASDAEWEVSRTELMAFIGYLVTGICGALLTPVIHAIVTLKGLPPAESPSLSAEMVAFGYGLAFGFAANKMLNSVSSLVLTQLLARQAAINAASASEVNAVMSRPPAVVKLLQGLPEKDFASDTELVKKVVSGCTSDPVAGSTHTELLSSLGAASGWKGSSYEHAFTELLRDQVLVVGHVDALGSGQGWLAVVTLMNLGGEMVLAYSWGTAGDVAFGRQEKQSTVLRFLKKDPKDLKWFCHAANK